mgnify:FL=1
MKSVTNTQLDMTVLDWPTYMRRAIELSCSVWTATPNPRVGCVIAKTGAMLGEGWHVGSGQPHAEVVALGKAGVAAKGATAFVSLEPCSHTGRTGPCSEALVESGIQQVVIATLDPNPVVAGKGVEQMEQAGIEVYHLLDFEQEARSVNAGYFKRREHGLPFVRLKLAMSLDGRTALASGESKWITGIESRSDVQKLRASASAVITGINTVLQDDPFLGVRTADLTISDEERMLNSALLERQPLRVIIDSQLQIPGTSKILTSEGKIKIYTLNKNAAVKNLTDNVQVISNGSSNKRVNLQFVLESLASDFSCNEVLIEAGPSLSGAFIEAELVDELILYIAPKLLGSDGKPLLNIFGMQSLNEFAGFSVQQLIKIGEDVRLTLKVDH